MNIQFLSDRYTIRDLLPQDADMIYEVLKNNTLFYKYHPPMVTVESILEDMEALPPNKGYEDKHYIGFFDEGALVAVMDLIEHYPNPETALLGFFAMNANLQGQGIGTEIISDSVAFLAQEGFKKSVWVLRKGILKAKHFG